MIATRDISFGLPGEVWLYARPNDVRPAFVVVLVLENRTRRHSSLVLDVSEFTATPGHTYMWEIDTSKGWSKIA